LYNEFGWYDEGNFMAIREPFFARKDQDMKSIVETAPIRTRERNKAPDGWRTGRSLVKEWSKGVGIIQIAAEKYRSSHPEWFHEYWSNQLRSDTEYYHPDLLVQIKKDLKIDALLAEKTVAEKAPDGWRTALSLTHEWSMYVGAIRVAAEKYRSSHPEWFHEYWSSGSHSNTEYYHSDLVARIKKDLNIDSRLVNKAPDGWRTAKSLMPDWYINKGLIQSAAEKYRSSHPEWFHEYWSNKLRSNTEYYHPDLIIQLKKDLNIDSRLAKKAAAEKAPKGWKTPAGLDNQWGLQIDIIQSAAEKYRSSHPEWFREYWSKQLRSNTEYYHPDLIIQLKKDLNIDSRLAKKAAAEKAPKGWRTSKGLLTQWGGDINIIESAAEKYRSSHPEWFREYWSSNLYSSTEYYHPNLIIQLEVDLADRIIRNKERRRQKELLGKFESFLQEVRKGDTAEARQIRELIEVFGASRYADVIQSFRAQFKDIPAEDVRGMIAVYLGDYIGGKKPRPRDWRFPDLVFERLSNLSFREGLFETLKEDCYRYYLECRRSGDVREAVKIIESYPPYLENQGVRLSHPGFELIVRETVAYCKDLWTKYKKPERFVDALKSDREFPDINQRMNIKELAEKKRIVIADEMGVGKSASVIMAKEELKVPCALVVVPSNVMETWRNYLSDDRVKGGYFKKGQAPRVLVIESTDQLEDAAKGKYEYVLISQERLGERYNAGLQKIPYTMLIADEFHKMKAHGGTRSESLVALAEKIEKGKDRYLALLSGTPIPNKVEDIAVALKLLYPERFKEMSPGLLALQIIKGDVIDLRKLLLPRLQMKKLRDCVEMPPLTEEKVEVEMGELEKEVYGVLWENDELNWSEKLIALRKFNLNPSSLEATPGFKGAKVEAVEGQICRAFETKKRALLFVNDYVEDVIRGDHTIFDQMDLPADILVLVIHGKMSPEERNRIQRLFQDRESSQKILLVVCGQTADVGVDYSAAEEVFFYNEPWTQSMKDQELGRANRPGLRQSLRSTTFVNKGTIEEGISRYIQAKSRAIQKILHGVPLNEMEIELLQKEEKRDESQGVEEVNAELATYYFSAWDRMMQYFGHTKEMGEERFKEFIIEYGKDYADGYQELGARSYQANANRVAGTLIERMLGERSRTSERLRILDLASGPEMLRRHLGETYQDHVISMDVNPHHFVGGDPSRYVVGGWTKMPFEDGTFNLINFSLALDQTTYIPSKGKLERLEVLMEMNRVLKMGGRVVLSMIYSVGFKNEPMFRALIEKLGFKVVEDYSGEASSGRHFRAGLVTLEKMTSLDPETSPDDFIQELTKEEREGLKFRETNANVKDTRKITDAFELNGTSLETHLNAQDRRLLQEERDVIDQADAMKRLHGDRVDLIPAKTIVECGFVRIKLGDKYILFKRLSNKAGVVVVR
jgi:ubiquinone/menaquinone biosynthesis C-methylase UbiE